MKPASRSEVKTVDVDVHEEYVKKHVPTDVSHMNKDVKGIPDYWATAMRNNKILMQNFREMDQPTL